MLGTNIRRLRTELDMTQAELAERVGVEQSSISMIECGERQPSLEKLLKLAQALSVGVGDLLRETEPAQQYPPHE